jgi:hypothetical protein
MSTLREKIAKSRLTNTARGWPSPSPMKRKLIIGCGALLLLGGSLTVLWRTLGWPPPAGLLFVYAVQAVLGEQPNHNVWIHPQSLQGRNGCPGRWSYLGQRFKYSLPPPLIAVGVVKYS